MLSMGGLQQRWLRAMLASGPALSGQVRFPFLLLKTFTFTDLAYIYQGTYGLRRPLWKQWCPLLPGNAHHSPNP